MGICDIFLVPVAGVGSGVAATTGGVVRRMEHRSGGMTGRVLHLHVTPRTVKGKLNSTASPGHSVATVPQHAPMYDVEQVGFIEINQRLEEKYGER
jgi:hypothetical protein